MSVARAQHRVCGRAPQDGFTFAELSVAMAAAIVVIIGLFSIMVVTLHQTQRTFTKVDATRRARTALADIENELHSACLVGSPLSQNGDPPIQAGSEVIHLIFLSYYGNVAESHAVLACPSSPSPAAR